MGPSWLRHVKTINIYFNYASKTTAGQVEIEDDQDIENCVQSWLKAGYAKARLGSTRQWIYINWQNIVYATYSHQDINEVLVTKS